MNTHQHAPAPAECATELGSEPPAVRSRLISMRHYSATRTWTWRVMLLVSFGLIGAMLFGCGGGSAEEDARQPEDASPQQQAMAASTRATPAMKVPRPPCQTSPQLCR